VEPTGFSTWRICTDVEEIDIASEREVPEHGPH